MGIALTSSQKSYLRKDASISAAAALYLDELLESLQTQIDNAAQSGAVTRADLIEEALVRYQQPLMACRNADGTVMDATGGAGLFAITPGGWGTGTLILAGEDAQNNTKTDTLMFEAVLPAEYVAGGDLKLNVNAQYDVSAGTTITATVDVQVYKLGDDGTVGSDLCATAAIALTTSFGDKAFTITATGLVAGDRLMALVQTAVTEAGNTGTATAQIGSIELQADIQG